MVSKALSRKHPRASNGEGFAPKYPSAVGIQEEHCGFPNRSVTFVCSNFIIKAIAKDFKSHR